jgi:hypothetical protein
MSRVRIPSPALRTAGDCKRHRRLSFANVRRGRHACHGGPPVKSPPGAASPCSPSCLRRAAQGGIRLAASLQAKAPSRTGPSYLCGLLLSAFIRVHLWIVLFLQGEKGPQTNAVERGYEGARSALPRTPHAGKHGCDRNRRGPRTPATRRWRSQGFRSHLRSKAITIRGTGTPRLPWTTSARPTRRTTPRRRRRPSAALTGSVAAPAEARATSTIWCCGTATRTRQRELARPRIGAPTSAARAQSPRVRIGDR